MKYTIWELKELVNEYGKSIKDGEKYEEVYAISSEIHTGYALDFINWLEARDPLLNIEVTLSEIASWKKCDVEQIRVKL